MVDVTHFLCIFSYQHYNMYSMESVDSLDEIVAKFYIIQTGQFYYPRLNT